MKGNPPNELLQAELATSQPCGKDQTLEVAEELRSQFHLWIRMLFSCLVDADFLDTEAYMTPADTKRRAESQISLEEARVMLDRHLFDLGRSAAQTDINQARQQILNQCRQSAVLDPGLFSLTVPTGGGKTLAGMAFALEHAIAHGKRRIVVAIPYTSIIEQTAAVYRGVFGDEAVIEHHCNLDPDHETRASRLASENWDAPIIVTTNVQLFESLFASRSSACRKLHNLVNSVIIIDEAQIQPVGFLQPVIEVMRGMVELFGATIVLSTATQPALAGSLGSGQATFRGFADGVVREIITDPPGLARRLRRVKISMHQNSEEAVPWEELAIEVGKHEQVLCIVNTRKDCRDFHALLPEGAVHLSALMCPEHRSETIARIKADLASGRAIRVVSTQLVEAGVDIDFPIVYRALAGLDSIAQAAGRCNREGRLGEGNLGKVIVFMPPKTAPSGMLRKGQDAGREMIRLFPEEVARLAPETFERYFKLLYGRVNSFDEKGIMRLLAGPDIEEAKVQFRTAASRFSLIDDGGQQAIIVDFASQRSKADEGLSAAALVAKVEAFGPDRATMRRLQRYTVNVPRNVFRLLQADGSIRVLQRLDGLYVQALPGLYDGNSGLRLDGPILSPMDFIA
jgi:CRISPR-associated endonuclease/helicase Cas3